MRRGTPNASTDSIARGNAASLDVVENAISAGSLMARKNPMIGMRNISITGTSTRLSAVKATMRTVSGTSAQVTTPAMAAQPASVRLTPSHRRGVRSCSSMPPDLVAPT